MALCVVTALVLVLAACGTDTIAGSGKVVSKEVPISSFSDLVVSDAFEVNVSLGGQEKLTLRVDDNLVDRLDVGVHDGKLRIGLKPGTSVRHATLQASVTARTLAGVDLSGASRLRMDGEVMNPSPREGACSCD